MKAKKGQQWLSKNTMYLIEPNAVPRAQKIRLDFLVFFNMPFTESEVKLPILRAVSTVFNITSPFSLTLRTVASFPTFTIFNIYLRIHSKASKTSFNSLSYLYPVCKNISSQELVTIEYMSMLSVTELTIFQSGSDIGFGNVYPATILLGRF